MILSAIPRAVISYSMLEGGFDKSYMYQLGLH